MKKILLSAILISSLFANEENFIEAGIGFSNSKDNFSTSNQNNVSTLSNASDENDAIALVNFNYSYNLSDDTSLYAGMDLGSLYFGSNIDSDLGLFDIGIMTSLEEKEWENPFSTNTNREKTDVSEFGTYIGYGFSLGEPHFAQLKYSYSKRDYDSESVQEDLKREGTRHVLSFENSISSENFTFLINTNYEKYNATGDASTYDLMTFGLGINTNLSKNLNLTLMGEFGEKQYDKSNPIFNKKIESDISSFIGILTYDKPFDYQNAYVSLTVGHEEEDANENFYDKENTFSLLSIGYKF